MIITIYHYQIKIIVKYGDRIVRILKVNIINFYIKIESTNILKKLL